MRRIQIKKAFSIVSYIIIIIIVVIIITAAVGTAIKAEPFLMVSVESNSMYPEFQRGDVIFICNANDSVTVGDIVLFKAEAGILASQGYVVHRLSGGNDIDGYITKGDANKYTDQESNTTTPIKREWIKSRVIQINGHVLKVPYIGYLTFWMDDILKSPFLAPVIIGLLAVLILLSMKKGHKKNGRGKKRLRSAFIISMCGLILSIMLSVSMLFQSQHVTLNYYVSSDSKGALQGSDIGILKIGDIAERHLFEVRNGGFIPQIVTVTTDDEQIDFCQDKWLLLPNETIEVTTTVNAVTEGKYSSIVNLGVFYPFLFTDWLYYLCQIDYILGLVVVSLIPGLPLIIYPFFNAKVRRRLVNKFRRSWLRVKCVLD